MREIRSQGSVRGVPGNRHSYRDNGGKIEGSGLERGKIEGSGLERGQIYAKLYVKPAEEVRDGKTFTDREEEGGVSPWCAG